MKRTLLQRGAIIAACAAAFALVSCGETEYDARTDTVYSLDTPSVTAKRYPGMNVVSWKPVTGAKSYNLTIYEDGKLKSSQQNVSYSSVTDTDLVNGKNYTYYVEAVSATNPGTTARAVYATNSRGEATVQAIVPPAGTNVLDLAAYENGYDANINVADKIKNDNFVISAENVTVNHDKTNVYVRFPVKAYLKYDVRTYNSNLPHDILEGTLRKTVQGEPNNTYAEITFPISGAGKYDVCVTASSVNNVYIAAEEIKATSVEIKALNLTTDTISKGASYLADGKTARIQFVPATKNNENVPTNWYKVYRNEKGKYEATPLTGTVTEGLRNSDTGANRELFYYIDDANADPAKTYEYIVAVTDGEAYGSSVKVSLTPRTPQEVPNDRSYFMGILGKPTANYINDTTARIKFDSSVRRNGAYAPASWYKVYRTIQNDLVVDEVKGDIKEVIISNVTITYTDKDGLEQSENAHSSYYIDDTVPDTTKKYIYYVVVTEPATLKYTVATNKLDPLSNKLELDPPTYTNYDSAQYLANGTTARISFTPAKVKGSTTYVDPTWYKVYRSESDSVEQTVLTGTVKVSNSGATPVYYIDDTIPDTTKTYKYVIAIEHDEKYGKAVEASLNKRLALNLKNQTGSVQAMYLNTDYKFETGADKTVRIWFEPARTKEDKPVSVNWYKVYRNEFVNGELVLENEVEITKNKKVTATTYVTPYGSTTEKTDYYYIEDTITDPAKIYMYTVVVTDGTEYGTSRTSDQVSAYKNSIDLSVSGSQEFADPSSTRTYKNSIEWTISDTHYSQLLKKSEIKSIKLCQVARDRDMDVNEFENEYTEVKTTDLKDVLGDNHSFTITTTVDEIKFGRAYLLVEVERDGYKTTYSSGTEIIRNY